jgi:hypothetical protein
LPTLLGDLFPGVLAWEPVLGHLEHFRIFGNLWDPIPGILAWRPCLGPFGNLFLGTLLGNLAWEPVPENLA